MKTFTAKQLSRNPAQVFDAAREDGEVSITHDRFTGNFELSYYTKIQTLDDQEDAKQKKLRLNNNY